jgi:hypothetical protein
MPTGLPWLSVRLRITQHGPGMRHIKGTTRAGYLSVSWRCRHGHEWRVAGGECTDRGDDFTCHVACQQTDDKGNPFHVDICLCNTESANTTARPGRRRQCDHCIEGCTTRSGTLSAHDTYCLSYSARPCLQTRQRSGATSSVSKCDCSRHADDRFLRSHCCLQEGSELRDSLPRVTTSKFRLK